MHFPRRKGCEKKLGCEVEIIIDRHNDHTELKLFTESCVILIFKCLSIKNPKIQNSAHHNCSSNNNNHSNKSSNNNNNNNNNKTTTIAIKSIK